MGANGMNTSQAHAWNAAFDDARADWETRYRSSSAASIQGAHTGIRFTLLSVEPGSLQEARILGAATALAGLLSTREI
jgi:hypothetical protein